MPAVFGWLGLDRRGRWRLEGELIGNDAANRFIDRNYARDEAGRWFFQNGPQRVFVTLEYAPFVYRLDDAGTLTAHTGRTARAAMAAFLDEEQNLTVATDLGPGLVDDRDLEALSERLGYPDGAPMDDDTREARLAEAAAGRGGPPGLGLVWEGGGVTPIAFLRAAELPARLGFVRSPAPDAAPAPARAAASAPGPRPEPDPAAAPALAPAPASEEPRPTSTAVLPPREKK